MRRRNLLHYLFFNHNPARNGTQGYPFLISNPLIIFIASVLDISMPLMFELKLMRRIGLEHTACLCEAREPFKVFVGRTIAVFVAGEGAIGARGA